VRDVRRFFYRNQEVAVIGGGDSAAEESTFLTKFASKVHLLVRRTSSVRQDHAGPRVQESQAAGALEHRARRRAREDVVEGIRVVDVKTGVEHDMGSVTGLFLAIGHTPNSKAFVDWIDHDEQGYLVTKPGSATTNIPGVFACGDVQDKTYRQAVTAAGSGCMAALEAERWLEAKHHEMGQH
jgi:thioredoxin reductase (NADPH)